MKLFATAVTLSTLLFMAGCAGDDEPEMEEMGEPEAGEMMDEDVMAPDTMMMMDTMPMDTMMGEGMEDPMMDPMEDTTGGGV